MKDVDRNGEFEEAEKEQIKKELNKGLEENAFLLVTKDYTIAGGTGAVQMALLETLIVTFLKRGCPKEILENMIERAE